MTDSNSFQIDKIIDEVIRYIPVVWPLQQFIATNPLWDAIEDSIENVTKTIENYGDEITTLPLSDYFNYYEQGRINQSNLEQAIDEYIIDLNKHADDKHTSSDHSAVKQMLYDFLTSKTWQTEILQKTKQNRVLNIKKSTSSLVSKSMELYSEGTVHEIIYKECLNWIATFFNPSSFEKQIHIQFVESDLHSLSNRFEFFNFWRALMAEKNASWKFFLSKQPMEVVSLIGDMLDVLQISDSHKQQYIFDICWQFKGWLGYIKWHDKYPNNPYFNYRTAIIEIIAMWLCYEVFWLLQTNKVKPHPILAKRANNQSRYDVCNFVWLDYLEVIKHGSKSSDVIPDTLSSLSSQMSEQHLRWLWQRAYELSHQEPLYSLLCSKKHQLELKSGDSKSFAVQTQKPAQWICCIDVRSEGLRYYLEKQNHETFGFAGFFGFAFQLDENGRKTCQCPALIQPDLQIRFKSRKQSCSKHIINNLREIIEQCKSAPLAAFALYEFVGVWYAFTLLMKNSMNALNLKLLSLIKRDLPKSIEEDELILEHINLDDRNLDRLTEMAVNLLKGTGLISQFAEFVIICGHKATTTNNPYQAALDCGACGGNAGTSNARLACAVLNQKKIRLRLARKGINIPDHTTFIPACHDTTTDQIYWYDLPTDISNDRLERLNRIKQNAMLATQELNRQRLKSLPGDSNVMRRAAHWAEVIPEWGLANNYAMIIGSRKLTSSINLNQRIFLHSYDKNLDHDGTILESILLGPVIVAHWINSQYYFSTVAPNQFGSGNKALHNVLPLVGVMEGNLSDLKYGLPQQCIFYRGQRRHEPIRLTVYIDAENIEIKKIIDKHAVLKSLVDGHWIWLKSLADSSNSYIRNTVSSFEVTTSPNSKLRKGVLRTNDDQLV